MSKQRFDGFNQIEPGLIAHSRVQVLDSCTLEDTDIPLFASGIQINLSLMDGEDGTPWLRIHRSPDHFAIIERTKNLVRLQHDWIWLAISTKEFDTLLAKAEAKRPGSTAHLCASKWSLNGNRSYIALLNQS